ncbi:hypothetical protein NDU88_010161 [Pleurodeles waltl]|uniref:Uncharacterized protein n=1 Tax=Pleurodeles waltl TaxID=8319 RepID=A0AAV7RYQ5_PLEWA|nr:hypothetical protein NDU88_010161 [Pleurodeles waltl]
MFPSKLKIMLEGQTQFCQDPNEAWVWLETYQMGTDKAQNEEPGSSWHRGKKRRTRGLVGNTRVTKPTQQQTSQGKKAPRRRRPPCQREASQKVTTGQTRTHQCWENPRMMNL